MAAKLYDAKQVQVIVGGVAMDGFVAGSFVEIAYNEEQYKLVVGADGQATRSRTNNLSARITIHLLQTSGSNDVLNGFFIADGESPIGAVLPLMVKDNSGRSLYVSESAWIVKPPDAAFDISPTDRSWIIETDALVPGTAGN